MNTSKAMSGPSLSLENMQLPAPLVNDAISKAFSEDLGLAGDITTNGIIPRKASARCQIVARDHGIIAGIGVAEAAFRQIDQNIVVSSALHDGNETQPGNIVATVEGNARAILTAERVALNFLGHMSGIATLTQAYVAKTAGSKAQIIDTRKTTPGLRAFEKYAVRAGGGMNHRAGLFDAVLIKDNHIAIAGGIDQAIAKAKATVGHLTKIEVEVDTLDQLAEVLEHDIDAVLLDNMTVEELRQAVALVDGRVLCEASGGVTLATVADIAQTGVDLISVGALTHSVPIFDFGLDFAATG